MVKQEIVLLLMVARMSLLLLSSASKYRSIYNSVSFDKDEMQYILNELDGCAMMSYIILIAALLILKLTYLLQS